jgi:hypothetical protein
MRSILQRKLGYEMEQPGGVPLAEALAIAQRAGRCTLEAFYDDRRVLIKELLIVEALRLMFVEAKALTTGRPHHLRYLFGGSETQAAVALGPNLPVLDERTIEKYVKGSSRFVLMVMRQRHLQDRRLWDEGRRALSGLTFTASSRVNAQLLLLLGATQGMDVTPSGHGESKLTGNLPSEEDYQATTDSILELLTALFHLKLDLFQPAFDHPVLRFTATLLHNTDGSIVTPRQVGSRCAPTLYLAKLTALLGLARQSQQWRAHNPQSEDPALTREQLEAGTMFLRGRLLDHPSPYLCILEVCQVANAIAQGQEDIPTLIWDPEDPSRRTLYVDGQRFSLDEHLIPGVARALSSYRSGVRDLIGPERFDSLYAAQMSRDIAKRPFSADEIRNRQPRMWFALCTPDDGAVRRAQRQFYEETMAECFPAGLHVSFRAGQNKYFGLVEVYCSRFVISHPVCLAGASCSRLCSDSCLRQQRRPARR